MFSVKSKAKKFFKYLKNNGAKLYTYNYIRIFKYI